MDLLGCGLTALITTVGFDVLKDYIDDFLYIFVILAVLFILILLILIFNKNWIFKTFLGIDKDDLSDTQTNVSDLVDAFYNKDINKGKENAKKISSKFLAWYSWSSYKQWVVQSISVIFLVFGTLLGSYLLYIQNELISSQNKRLDQQTYLQEAERRSSLVFLFSNLMDAIDKELTNNSERNLSPQLIGRIIALSSRLTPYQHLEGDTLISEPLSPERGQLLIALAKAELSKETYLKIFNNSSFAYSSLRNVNLDGAYLENIDLSYSNLSYSSFKDANLFNANLTKVNLEQVHFFGTNLKKAQLLFTIGKPKTFWYSDLSDARITDSLWIKNISNIFLNTHFNIYELEGDYLINNKSEYDFIRYCECRNILKEIIYLIDEDIYKPKGFASKSFIFHDEILDYYKQKHQMDWWVFGVEITSKYAATVSLVQEYAISIASGDLYKNEGLLYNSLNNSKSFPSSISEKEIKLKINYPNLLRKKLIENNCLSNQKLY